MHFTSAKKKAVPDNFTVPTQSDRKLSKTFQQEMPIWMFFFWLRQIPFEAQIWKPNARLNIRDSHKGFRRYLDFIQNKDPQ